MKIYPVQNYNQKFTSSAAINSGYNNNCEDRNNKSQNKQEVPNWLRKSMIGVLLFFTFKNDPTVQNFFRSEDNKIKEKARTEFFEDAIKLDEQYNLPSATYHLNRLIDVDNAEIKHNGFSNYKISLKLDNDKNIETQISLVPLNSNELMGFIKKDGKITTYKAIFSNENPKEFEIIMRNKDKEHYVFGRTTKGEFYQLKNNKKIVLNKANVDKYQQQIKDLEILEDPIISFLSDKNDLWRKLNILLLIYLLANEALYDSARRNKGNEEG